jgi:hypothetical protein
MFDTAYVNSYAEGLSDSIIMANNSLMKSIGTLNFNLLNDNFQILTDSTEIQVKINKREPFAILSWVIGNPAPTPPYCNNVIIYKNRKPYILSSYDGSESDFGNNVIIDSMVNFPIDGAKSILLIGSNSCGNLCIKQTVESAQILGDTIQLHKRAFFDGTDFLDIVEFDYSPNTIPENALKFELFDSYLTVPKLNSGHSKVIGRKKYQLLCVNKSVEESNIIEIFSELRDGFLL